ncbi:MAG: alpha/beta fold hydrolase [Elainellaceae cyanobacterium]
MSCDYSLYCLGDIILQSGKTLSNAQLAYATFGTLNSRKDNAILLLTYYTGTHNSYLPMIGPGRALDPDLYFIIIINMFGNGVSSSPSNALPPHNGGHFPHITLYDNVKCQHRLITEQFGIDTLALVAGWSMGAQQTFHWAALYPDQVKNIVPWCGSAKTSIHNGVFLEGVNAALTADATWQNGFYTHPPKRGLKAFGRVYAGWAYSQTFFRERLYTRLGFDSAEALLLDWERDHLTWDANDLLAMLWSWQQADISANEQYQGDFRAALGRIKARAIVMPAATDLYFTPEDSAFEVEHMPNAELRVIPTVWGHCAGGPGRNPEDIARIEGAIAELLNDSELHRR